MKKEGLDLDICGFEKQNIFPNRNQQSCSNRDN